MRGPYYLHLYGLGGLLIRDTDSIRKPPNPTADSESSTEDDTQSDYLLDMVGDSGGNKGRSLRTAILFLSTEWQGYPQSVAVQYSIFKMK